ncbi:MAG: lysylphosphatidylglycerol synthase transmembrane domain-containing protein [Candidatus Hydrothermarchaeota archaeon]
MSKNIIKKKDIIKALLFSSIGIAVFLYLTHRIGFDEIKRIVKDLNFVLYFVAIIIYLLTFTLRAFRWKLIFKPVSKSPNFKESFLCIYSGYLLNFAFPARLGDFFRAFITKNRLGIKFRIGISTIIWERFFDLLAFAVVLSFLFLFSGSFIVAGKYLYFTYALLSMVFLSVVLLIFSKKFWSYLSKDEFSEKISYVVPISRFGEGVSDTMMEILKSREIILVTIFFSLIIWGLDALRVFIVCKSLASFEFWMKMAIASLLAGMIMSSTFNPLGTGELSGMILLSVLMIVPPDIAAAITIVDRIMVVGLTISLGIVSTLFLLPDIRDFGFLHDLKERHN